MGVRVLGSDFWGWIWVDGRVMLRGERESIALIALHVSVIEIEGWRGVCLVAELEYIKRAPFKHPPSSSL